MPRNSPVKLHRASTVFSKFCLDMEILPSYTPIFLVDLSGRILKGQKLVTAKEDFKSIYNLVDSEDVPFMLEQERRRDAYAVRGKMGDGKNYIVVSKDRDGFSRCVVCSYSEDKCIRLHDYIEKLCSYKDYLDSFSDLAFSCVARLPVKRLFRMKISGALELVNLATNPESDSERKISFPVSLAFEKLSAFVSKANGAEVCFENEYNQSEVVVNTPEVFFKLAVSAMALVLRHSINAKAYVSVKRLTNENNARIVFLAKSRGSERDIYETSLVSAFRERGLDCGILDDGREYSLFVDVPVEKRVKTVLSDVETISLRLDDLMSSQELQDMYYTISDI